MSVLLDGFFLTLNHFQIILEFLLQATLGEIFIYLFLISISPFSCLPSHTVASALLPGNAVQI